MPSCSENGILKDLHDVVEIVVAQGLSELLECLYNLLLVDLSVSRHVKVLEDILELLERGLLGPVEVRLVRRRMTG